MPKYRKKPVVIEAFQLTMETRWNNADWPNWMNAAWQKGAGEGGLWPDVDEPIEDGQESASALVCGTLRGVARISMGDYILRGVEGEIYTCKPGIFEKTYEAVEPDMPPPASDDGGSYGSVPVEDERS